MDDKLGRSLKKVAESLTNVATRVHSLKDGEDSRFILKESFNEIIEQLGKIESRHAGEEFMVPIELVQALDSGSHPDFWFRNILDKMGEKQKEVQSKAAAIKAFHGHLTTELKLDRPTPSATALPEDAEEEIVID